MDIAPPDLIVRLIRAGHDRVTFNLPFVQTACHTGDLRKARADQDIPSKSAANAGRADDHNLPIARDFIQAPLQLVKGNGYRVWHVG